MVSVLDPDRATRVQALARPPVWYSLYTTETAINSDLMGRLFRMQTLPIISVPLTFSRQATGKKLSLTSRNFFII